MSKHRYANRIVIRQEDGFAGHWYVLNDPPTGIVRVTHLHRIDSRVMRFSSIAEAKLYMQENKLPTLGGAPWEIYSKWMKVHVSPARKRLSERYCQDKRIVAGCFTTLISRATRAGYKSIAMDLQKLHTMLSNRLSADYERTKKGLEENGK